MLVEDASREGLLRRVEAELEATQWNGWAEHVEDDAQRLGAWRSLMPLLVGA